MSQGSAEDNYKQLAKLMEYPLKYGVDGSRLRRELGMNPALGVPYDFERSNWIQELKANNRRNKKRRQRSGHK